MIALTRRYAFPAAHVLRHASYTDEENFRVYGKCANPAGHGHNYQVEVTLMGPLDPVRGWIVEPALVDALFEEHVGSRLGGRMLNDDPWFENLVPTAENIARVISRELAAPIREKSTAEVRSVRIVETRKNSFVDGEIQ
ncbi:6-carboxytetrahydropterin synthase [Myxococcota bacterium]|nr:6-carboxytetrahydropterin synthase [Myxococcota bacterium]